ncbi:MAG: hypothetical protein ABI539_10405 [Acidobacteriota bacterium]
MRKSFFRYLLPVSVALLVASAAVFAQPRSIEKATIAPVQVDLAPASFEAKYEGGFFGYSKKENGTLKFDDVNLRLVFYGEDQKEKFAVPYSAMQAIYPQSKSVTSTAGSVVSHIPLPGAGLAGLIREKRRYLVMHFDDPDVDDARGVINFKLETKELLDSVIRSIGEKANLLPRGDAYVRPKTKAGS